jgi:hypothetical protein
MGATGEPTNYYQPILRRAGQGACKRHPLQGQGSRWMGGALLGAALASFPGVAWAEGGRCSEGQTRCGDRCVNLKTNERHCGSCSNRCRSNQRCCNGNCVNLQKNERHCGRCFNRCAQGEECVDGVCGGAACPAERPVRLSNGTCAKPCPNGDVDCAGCTEECSAERNTGDPYCVNIFIDDPCDATIECPPGQFCTATEGVCAEAC